MDKQRCDIFVGINRHLEPIAICFCCQSNDRRTAIIATVLFDLLRDLNQRFLLFLQLLCRQIAVAILADPEIAFPALDPADTVFILAHRDATSATDR